MKTTGGWKAGRVCLASIVLMAAAMPATAQLEIGGQPFESTGSTPAAATNDNADSAPAAANELTRRIQLDLVALGYEPGSINGEMSVETAIAISKFQAENGLDVSGEASPQLAGILAARVSAMRGETAATAGAAQNEAGCLRETAAETSSTSRNAGRLARAGGRLLSRLGADNARDEISDAAQAASDVADAADAVGDLTNCE